MTFAFGNVLANNQASSPLIKEDTSTDPCLDTTMDFLLLSALYPRLKTLTVCWSVSNTTHTYRTIGVLPVPPTVILPILMTGTGMCNTLCGWLYRSLRYSTTLS